jgi:molybdopterin/thiamine biosynthesis adenylyltransferase
MTDEQIRRYARHILLPDVGGTGQERLLAARCVVAVGPDRAAETCALMYLAAAGVGSIGLTGDLLGLIGNEEQRGQPVYATDDVGRPRGPALTARLAALNPDARVVVATTLGDGVPTLEVPPAQWLAFAPPVSAALARGGAAACALLARLYTTS